MPGRFSPPRDVITAAKGLLPELRIGGATWRYACELIGPYAAALCVLVADRAVLRAGAIVYPAAYVRAMAKRALTGELALDRSLFGLAFREGGRFAGRRFVPGWRPWLRPFPCRRSRRHGRDRSGVPRASAPRGCLSLLRTVPRPRAKAVTSQPAKTVSPFGGPSVFRLLPSWLEPREEGDLTSTCQDGFPLRRTLRLSVASPSLGRGACQAHRKTPKRTETQGDQRCTRT